ncbi:hypothetical protein CKM354_000942200 [Cercospora kikuchii]|uniref:Zn(2)-C6 fungal-type domain-containing protein n=1 Tax=Cercospora kikuchii TaxID=84275 RepID=A0A9P3FJ56_9PEZI|nr:uncharacterized protein CKM354_000942200 [Cercospora kikuchii]GIZ46292.1 hypothetical protein CKM354_000942200 [Cercospora kikuchii]
MERVHVGGGSESPQGDLKRIRKGTKSCVECRQRKVRCLWADERDSVCTPCQQRGRKCVPQLYTRRNTTTNKVSSKDRIARLEAQLANITATVQSRSQTSPGRATSAASETTGPVFDEHESDTDERLMQVGSQPPEHLRILFDNALIGPDERGPDFGSRSRERPPCSTRYLDQARAKLQTLVPARDDVIAVSSYAVPWMSLYFELFPATSATPNRDEMVNQHEHMLKPDADPVKIASFLLSFAMTARQIPADEHATVLPGIKNIDSYVKSVMAVVEAVIVSHTGIASTVEGMSATILYLRLQFGFGQSRPLWLTLRRIVALAELSGLPRAWDHAQNDSAGRAVDPIVPLSGTTSKVALWETICATDRLASMMFNLPAATSTRKFPPRQVVDTNGMVHVQRFMFQLAGISMHVTELDEGYMCGQTVETLYDKVLAADKELRALKSLTPVDWWQESAQYLSASLMVQFWHCYFTARVHLHTAMAQDEHDQYAYSRMQCLEACHALARRYSHVRRALPSGFFLCRIVDMQVFTAAVYLLLSSFDSNLLPRHDEGSRLRSVEQIIMTMEFVSGQAGSDFARDAAAALKGLIAHLSKPANSNEPGLTLRVPLLGSIHVGRRSEGQSAKNSETNAQPSAMPISGTNVISSTGHQITDPFYAATSYQPWMQLDVGDSFQDPFFADDTLLDQWANINNTMPMLNDVEMYGQGVRHI